MLIGPDGSAASVHHVPRSSPPPPTVIHLDPAHKIAREFVALHRELSGA